MSYNKNIFQNIENNENEKDKKGFIYLIQENFFINTNIYKIGRTNDIELRLKNYPKNSNLIFVINVNEQNEIETILIRIFKKIFIYKNEYGKEYFEGNKDDMIKEILKYLEFRKLYENYEENIKDYIIKKYIKDDNESNKNNDNKNLENKKKIDYFNYYYNCKRCLYKTIIPCDIKRHLERKIKCKPHKDYILLSDEELLKQSLTRLYKDSEKIKQDYQNRNNTHLNINNDLMNNCNYCLKKFKTNQSLKRHLITCKNKEIIENNTININNTNNTNENLSTNIIIKDTNNFDSVIGKI